VHTLTTQYTQAQALAATFVDLIENTGGYFKALGKSFSTAAKTFDSNSLPGDKITTFDTMFETGWKAAKAVKASHSLPAERSCRTFLAFS
jgi:hypothetical protein